MGDDWSEQDRIDECPTCLDERRLEILHGSQAGLDSPRTRLVTCPDCGDMDEPDYDRDDGRLGREYADEEHYAGEGCDAHR